MTKSIQNIVGDSTEQFIANFLRENGYWAYILPKKVGGQPFDIIAFLVSLQYAHFSHLCGAVSPSSIDLMRGR